MFNKRIILVIQLEWIILFWACICPSAEVLFKYVPTMNVPGRKEDKNVFLFADLFVGYNHIIYLISNRYNWKRLNFDEVALRWLNNDTLTYSEALYPSKVIDEEFANSWERYAIAEFKHVHLAQYMQNEASLQVAISYSNSTPVEFLLENTLYHPRTRNIGIMSIIVEQHSLQEIQTWIQYYHKLGIKYFNFYYNIKVHGALDRNSCDPNKFQALNSLTLELACSTATQLMADLHTLVTSVLQDDAVFIEVLDWSFLIQWYKVVKGQHHSQTQALQSALYRFKGVTKWLLNFDLDEYAVVAGDMQRHLDAVPANVTIVRFACKWAVLTKSRKMNLTVADFEYPFAVRNLFTCDILVSDLQDWTRSKYAVRTDKTSRLNIHHSDDKEHASWDVDSFFHFIDKGRVERVNKYLAKNSTFLHWNPATSVFDDEVLSASA